MGKARTVATVGALAGAVYVYATQVRPWMRRWGARGSEVDRPLPGDNIVENPRYVTTRGITINAPPTSVWPWLAQMGQGKAGLYSYDWLESLLGWDLHNADRVVPEWQAIKVGDEVRLTPKERGDLYFTVARVEPEGVLVLRTPGTPEENKARGYPWGSWAFFLEPLDGDRTRLVVRWRSDFAPTLVSSIANQYGLEPAQFLMERKMLLGIKERAERLWRELGAESPAGR